MTEACASALLEVPYWKGQSMAKWRIERTDVPDTIDVPEDLMDRITDCEKELADPEQGGEIIKAAGMEHSPEEFWNKMNGQTSTEQIDVVSSIGLGFDCGYMQCRQGKLMRWYDMWAIADLYSMFEQEAEENGTKWVAWEGKKYLRNFSVWNDFLRDLIKDTSVPVKDAFLQGWCQGVQRFFLSICALIECPEADRNLN
jgi:hypothetical protein